MPEKEVTKSDPICVRCKHPKSDHVMQVPFGCKACGCLFFSETAKDAEYVFYGAPLGFGRSRGDRL